MVFLCASSLGIHQDAGDICSTGSTEGVGEVSGDKLKTHDFILVPNDCEISWDTRELWCWRTRLVLWVKCYRPIEGNGWVSICGLNHFMQQDSLTFPHLFRPLSTVFLQLCVCISASEAHLVVGLLVQRDRRVIKGVLDWLPVKDCLPEEETVQLWHIH